MIFNRKSKNLYDKRLDLANKNSMSGINVIKTLHDISLKVHEKGIKGDIVECGVWNGGSAASLGIPIIDSSKNLWLFDSFEGMPITTDKDGLEAQKYIGQCVGDELEVSKLLNSVKFPRERIFIKKGWFQDTFKQPLPLNISILHIDADWYDSVMICLDTFYDLVEDGGVIILDDFGHWEGCRESFYDFTFKRGIKPLIERFGHTQMYWVKGKENNRSRSGVIGSIYI